MYKSVMELNSIKETFEENNEFVNSPDCKEIIRMSVDIYKKVGYHPLWIGYYKKKENQFVGSAGFKDQPVNAQVDIAYGTFEKFRQKGFGTIMCKQIVQPAKRTNPSVIITTGTMSEKNYSTRILKSNDFELQGTVIDEEDGEVWE